MTDRPLSAETVNRVIRVLACIGIAVTAALFVYGMFHPGWWK